MDPRSPTFEANLLYKTAPKFTLVNLVETFRSVLADFGETLLDATQIDPVFTHLTCNTVDILLAYCEAPLPVEHFLGAERPAASSFSEAEVLARLKENHASFTILVSDRNLDDKPYGAAQDALKRGICWSLSDCIQSKIFAELVFWSDTDMLYAGEEFDRACTYSDHQETGVEYATPDHDTQQTAFRAPNVDAINVRADIQFDQRDIDDLAPDNESFHALVAAANTPSGAANLPLMRWAAMNGMAMACTAATISLVLLPGLHFLMP